MIALLHLVIGALLASRVKPLALGLVLAFISHYALDLMPHWNYAFPNLKGRNFRKAAPELAAGILDVSVGIAVIYFIADNFLIALLGGIIAMLPDILTLAGIIFTNPVLAKISEVSEKIHFPKEKNSVPVGVVIETITLAIGIILFLQ